MNNPFKLKILDQYIIKKFLGTFFFAILLIISICVVFDLSEKIDDFMTNAVPFKAIVFEYYLNFIPYFANLFSGLFTFIAVIFITSKMAFNTEIIAILSSGVPYRRLMFPFLFSAFIIFVFSYSLGNFVIPHAMQRMTDFKYTYISKNVTNKERDIHLQLEPNVFIYLSKYDIRNDYGETFSIERFEGNKLVSKLSSVGLKWNREKKIWEVKDYVLREMRENEEIISTGAVMDTTLKLLPEEFAIKNETVETMNLIELTKFIKKQKLRGVNAIEKYEIERHRRAAVAFSSFILSIIGVSLASRKVRGGIGLHLGFGLLLSFTYIMFQQVAKVFSLSGAVSPLIAMWIPNFIFAVVAVFLYRWASK